MKEVKSLMQITAVQTSQHWKEQTRNKSKCIVVDCNCKLNRREVWKSSKM